MTSTATMDAKPVMKDVERARQTYVDTMLAFREMKPTRYMTDLQFKPQTNAGDPDTPLVTTEQLKQAAKEHKATIPVGWERETDVNER